MNHKEWAEPLGEIKSVIKSETGELWTTVTLTEYMRASGNYVPLKVSKFKRWREAKRMSFWYKVHRMANERNACDRGCC